MTQFECPVFSCHERTLRLEGIHWHLVVNHFYSYAQAKRKLKDAREIELAGKEAK
tara:strand:- start:3946 stop:4110 length:165 start_codon:yes stop_codon:yes gene_type:complete